MPMKGLRPFGFVQDKLHDYAICLNMDLGGLFGLKELHFKIYKILLIILNQCSDNLRFN